MSSTLKETTVPPSPSSPITRSLMKPQSTMFIPKSGSMMVERALSTSPSLDVSDDDADADGGGSSVDLLVGDLSREVVLGVGFTT